MKRKSANTNSKSFYFLLAIIFLLPIPLGANRPWAWGAFEVAIFCLTIIIVVKQWRVHQLGLAKYANSLYLWLAFIALSVLQILPLPNGIVDLLSPTSVEFFTSAGAEQAYISVDPGQSGISFIKLLSFFCLFVSVLNLVNSEQRLRQLLLCLVAAGTFQALYGSLEILLGSTSSLVFSLPVTDIATGSFVYKNHYANFLVLCLAAGLGLLVSSLENSSATSAPQHVRNFAKTLLSSKMLVRICLAIMVIALVMSRSRMGNTAFFASLAIVSVLAFMLIKNRSRGLTVLIISIFVIDLLIVSTYFGLARVKERLAQTSITQETRDEVVQDAFPMIIDFPIFGSGGGSFYSSFPNYQMTQIDGFYDHAHNDYLQFLIEYGMIGLFILLALVLFCVYKAVRAMRVRRTSIMKGSAFACLVAFFAMAMHSTVDFPLQAYANACYFVVFLAISMITSSLRLKQDKVRGT